MYKKIILSLSVLAMSGCATIVKGTSQNINFSTSTGESVKATLIAEDGTSAITLPRTRSVETSAKDILIEVKETKCNESSTTIVESKLNPWFFGNIFFYGGFFSSTADAVTGAMWEYDKNVMVEVNEKAACVKK